MPCLQKMPIAESPLAKDPVGESDDSNSQFSSQIFIVVFGGDVRRTEGVKVDSQLIRAQFHPQDFLGGSHVQSQHHLDARINYGTLIP